MAYTPSGESASLVGASRTVTVVEGRTFCLSDSTGDIEPERPHGLFVDDRRLLSRWRLLLDGVAPEPLASSTTEPFAARFVLRGPPPAGEADSTVLVLRERWVGSGLREDVVVRNLGSAPLSCELTVEAGCDGADLFAVKENRVQVERPGGIVVLESELQITGAGGTVASVRAAGWTGKPDGRLVLRLDLPGRGEWRGVLQVQPLRAGALGAVAFPSDEPPQRAEPVQRLRSWRDRLPTVRSGSGPLNDALARTTLDLGALRVRNTDFPDRVALAAGAPWFMTVFGRDSLLSSWMALPIDPSLAVGTVRTLAASQGVRDDPTSEEQPGRIMHEVRADGTGASGGGSVYYGSIDATPLFVMLVGELRRWGASQDVLDELRPAVQRAVTWLDERGDIDGDGFVEYERSSPTGLLHQGWKDSFDGISFADGRLAQPPIALAEVQGYVYAARLAHAELADAAGDAALAERSRAHAARLRRDFDAAYWLPDSGSYALALDRHKQPVDAVASHLGHCLWTGIVADGRAEQVADRLLAPDMSSGWGLRTLSASSGRYNPMGYHTGSVWPHDTAIAVAGLARYGFVDHAQRLASALLDAAAAFSGRLPELFCGFDRDELDRPVPYPTSCSPQAWASASPLLLLRALLRLDPDLPGGVLHLAPVIPPQLLDLHLHDMPLGDGRISIQVSKDGLTVHGLAPGLLARTPRPVHGDDPSLP